MTDLASVVSWLDATLRTSEIPDYPGAINGLQLDGRRPLRKVATAVDFSAYAAEAAVRIDADLLLVHHGMFWAGSQPIRGARYRALSALISTGVAVYSSHLPLDAHPALGNNVLLARELGLTPTEGFARYQGLDVGVAGNTDVTTSELVRRVTDFAQLHRSPVVITPHAADRRTRRWGLCTGAGASSATIAEAGMRDIDTLIVGEGAHHTGVEARDAGLVIIYAGHYATETLGVRALGDALARQFGLTAEFIDAPTGL